MSDLSFLPANGVKTVVHGVDSAYQGSCDGHAIVTMERQGKIVGQVRLEAIVFWVLSEPEEPLKEEAKVPIWARWASLFS